MPATDTGRLSSGKATFAVGAVLEGDRAGGGAGRRGQGGSEGHRLIVGRGIERRGQRGGAGCLLHGLDPYRGSAAAEVRAASIDAGDRMAGDRQGLGGEGGLAAAERARAQRGWAVLEGDRDGGGSGRRGHGGSEGHRLIVGRGVHG